MKKILNPAEARRRKEKIKEKEIYHEEHEDIEVF